MGDHHGRLPLHHSNLEKETGRHMPVPPPSTRLELSSVTPLPSYHPTHAAGQGPHVGLQKNSRNVHVPRAHPEGRSKTAISKRSGLGKAGQSWNQSVEIPHQFAAYGGRASGQNVPQYEGPQQLLGHRGWL